MTQALVSEFAFRHADDIFAVVDFGRLRGSKPVEADALELWFLAVRGKTVCPLSRGGSPYTAPSTVTRSGRADPHRRRTSRGTL